MPSPTPANGPSPIDLTTVAYLQQYIGAAQQGTSADVSNFFLQRLVTAASKTAQVYCGRNFFVTPRVGDLYDGTGTQILVLRYWPIILITNLQVQGYAGWCGGWSGSQPVFPSQPFVIPPSVNGQPGYVFEPGSGTIRLVGGYTFPYGSRNVSVNYLSGFTETFPENQTITTGTVTLNNGATFVQNFGVVYASGPNVGKVLQLVPSAPAAGQYTVSATGVYGFNSADNALLVTVTYQFGQPPYDLQDAVCEIAASEYRRTQHIDQDSQVMGESTISFARLAIPRLAQMRLEEYKNRLPAQ
jgi:hypothetical protein